MARTKLLRYPEAVEDYARALELDPADAATHATRGWVYLATQSPLLALPDFEAALRLQRGQAAAQAARGWMQLAGQSSVLALADFAEAVRIKAAGADAYNGRGFAQVKLGHYAEGVADAEAALKQGPRTAELSYGAARVFAQAASAVQVNHDGTDRDRRALELRGRYRRRALDLLSQALRGPPAGGPERSWRERVRNDRAFDAIRREPRFYRLIDHSPPMPEQSPPN
jgi:tetratricopeptide (TPR) repeat protein